MKRGKTIAATLLLLAIPAFFAFGQAIPKSSKDVMVVSSSAGEPGNLHPYATISVGKKMCGSAVYENLFFLNDDGSISGLLAESWDISNPLMLVVKLRKNVKFHNGDTMKASDVKFSFELLAQSPGAKSNIATIAFDKISVVDDYTVRIPMTEVNSSIIPAIATNDTFIISEKAYKALGDNFQQQPVGTGPFKFSKWVKGDRLEVVRFDDYWGGKAALAKIIIRFIAEPSQAMVELETGGVDLVMDALPGDILKARKDKNLQVIAGAFLRNSNMMFNHSREPMRNKKVRQAIMYAIDREAAAGAMFENTGLPAVSPYAQGMWGFNPELKTTKYPYKYNLDKAKQLLKEAGYEKGFTATLFTITRPYQALASEIIQSSLAKIGITVNIKTFEMAAMKQILVTGVGFDMFMLDNVGSAAEPLTGMWRDSHPKYATVNNAHYLFYKDNDNAAKYADTLDDILGEMNFAKKKALVYKLQDIFVEDLPWAFIATKGNYFLAVKNLKGFRTVGDIAYLGSAAMYFQ